MCKFLTFILLLNLTLAISHASSDEDESTRFLGQLWKDDIMGISPYFYQPDKQYRWPNATIPYRFDADYPLETQQSFHQAIEYISSLTCIQFKPQTFETDYIKVISDVRCSSYVGRVGGEQIIDLPLKCQPLGVVIHELIHTIGFFHEQSRQDRDNYVKINWENIVHGAEPNFEKKNEQILDYFGIEYDLGSIMHYPTNFFTINGKDTVTTIPPGIPIGQLDGMSPKDVLKINRLYECNEKV